LKFIILLIYLNCWAVNFSNSPLTSTRPLRSFPASQRLANKGTNFRLKLNSEPSRRVGQYHHEQCSDAKSRQRPTTGTTTLSLKSYKVTKKKC